MEGRSCMETAGSVPNKSKRSEKGAEPDADDLMPLAELDELAMGPEPMPLASKFD